MFPESETIISLFADITVILVRKPASPLRSISAIYDDIAANSDMQVRIRDREIRLHILLNYSFIVVLCCFNSGVTIMNVAEQLSPQLIHLPTQPQVGCNGHIELCDRSYSNITQIAAHDSAFVGILPMDNQNVFLPTQLDAGIRFLQGQTHIDRAGTLSLCHTNCGLKDGGSLTAYLATLKRWLDTHPKEVVTLLLTNGDYANITEFEHAFNSSGIVPYVYIPTAGHNSAIVSTWPTLNELILSNRRLVAFLDYGASPSVPYILKEFEYFWETPFDTIDPSFSQCHVDRPLDLSTKPKILSERMYLMNHYLDTEILGMDLPNRRDAKRTNAFKGKGSIGAQVSLCTGMHGRAPKGIMVDYFDQGEVFEAQDALNGF